MYVCAGGKEMSGKEDVPRDLQGCLGQLLDIRKVEAGMERDATVGRASGLAVLSHGNCRLLSLAWLYRWCLFPPHTGP